MVYALEAGTAVLVHAMTGPRGSSGAGPGVRRSGARRERREQTSE